MWDIFLTQITDVFRIGLIAALVYTTLRTAATTGFWLPLAAGLVFVAVIIPTTAGKADPVQIGVGLGANAAILAVLLGALALYRRLAAPR